MKRIMLVALLSFATLNLLAQGGMYGFQGGVGRAMSYKSFYTPALSGYCLGRITRSIYVGGEVSMERLSFHYASDIPPGSVKFGDVIDITHKSSYLFFSPKVDFGIGYRKYLHLNFTFGGGVFMGGSQWTNKYEPLFTFPTPITFRSDTAGYATTANIPTLMLRYGVGLSERLPTHGYWNITLSQEFGYMARSFDKAVSNLTSNYISFSVGIMHKYPMVASDDD